MKKGEDKRRGEEAEEEGRKDVGEWRGLYLRSLPKREQRRLASSPKDAVTSPGLLSRCTECIVEGLPFKKPGSAISHSLLSPCFLYLCESFPYISHVVSLVLYNNSSEEFQS
jgi:hypothetical protein